jgi:hypothetical protein
VVSQCRIRELVHGINIFRWVVYDLQALHKYLPLALVRLVIAYKYLLLAQQYLLLAREGFPFRVQRFKLIY